MVFSDEILLLVLFRLTVTLKSCCSCHLAPLWITLVFSWLMAVGTIVCASLWSEFTANERSDDRYNELSLKVSSNGGTEKDDAENEIIEINAKSGVVFVITASTFLVLDYLFMLSWFVWLLIVLFCIGGTEGICLTVTLLQMARLPKIKVVTMLHCCAFVYDIFWVFQSLLKFRDSVVVARVEMAERHLHYMRDIFTR